MHLAINGWFWNQPHTGSGQYTRQLVYYLNRLVSDLDITLIYPDLPGGNVPHDLPPSVMVHHIATRPGHLGKIAFEQQQFPQACLDVSADLAHVPYWGSPLYSPVPIVVTIHDLTTHLIPEYRRTPQTRAYNALVTASAKGANHIITDSFYSKLDLVEHFAIPEAKITAIYLGVNTTLYKPESQFLLDMAIQQQYDLPDSYVLYLGGYSIHKNVPTLLQAYRYVANALGEDYPLLLAGKKPTKVSAHFPDYDAIIHELELEKFVRWIGFVEEEHKPVLYRSASAFAFPSRAEGFGLPPLEAMACGTPVVTTNATSLPEVVGNGAFTVDPDDVRGMGGAIIATIVQENLAKELRERGLEQVKQFQWEETAVETLLIYDKVLATAG